MTVSYTHLDVYKRQVTDQAMEALENTFRFLEDAFGESQEMAAFLAELNTNGDSIRFLRDNDCPYFYKYNKGLLLDVYKRQVSSSHARRKTKDSRLPPRYSMWQWQETLSMPEQSTTGRFRF